jgi:hypothetical protein
VNVIPQTYPLFAIPVELDAADGQEHVHPVHAVVGWRVDSDGNTRPITTALTETTGGYGWEGDNVNFDIFFSQDEAEQARPKILADVATGNAHVAATRADHHARLASGETP